MFKDTGVALCLPGINSGMINLFCPEIKTCTGLHNSMCAKCTKKTAQFNHLV